MVKILHLSDLHFCEDAQAYNMKNIILNEAKAVHDLSKGEKLLVITGDFHNFWSNDYAQAEAFFDELVRNMDIDPAEDVFIVPGNHDVGNDNLLKNAGVNHRHAKSARMMIKHGDMSYLDECLDAFVPYCEFARRIGVYSDTDLLRPARVHVQRWRERLNILQLNTALVADGKSKDSQMADIVSACSDETWKEFYRDDLPALALGHNSFYDMAEAQQNAMKTMFVHRNVSAYLCGDTHRKNLDAHTQDIPLEFGYKSNRNSIPNIICVKGVAELSDDYSDFGFYWHNWDTNTDKVVLTLRSWEPDNVAETYHEGKSSGYYCMRRKTNAPISVDSHKLPAQSLKSILNNILTRTRDNHPSFVMLRKDGIDERLFPRSAELEEFKMEGRTEQNGPVSPVWDIIRRSWTKKRNVVIEGSGGIGKTITLFSITNMQDDTRPPAVYVPMHRLVDENGSCIELSAYLEKIHKEITDLAKQDWVEMPRLLVLLDGFNEVPGGKRRAVLHMVNDWQLANTGTQLIAVSRPMDGMNLGKELKGNPVCITLEPLSRDIVAKYLGDRTPDNLSSVWEVLTRPLFLNLYIKTDRLDGMASDGYALAPKNAEGGGTLIWNYLQRELLREDSESWVLRCTLACEYFIPYIAYRMEREYRFSIKRERAIKLIQEAISNFDARRLPHHIAEIFCEYESRHFNHPDLSSFDWNQTVFNDVGLLKTNRDNYEISCSFVHQDFRDCLAGLHLVNQAEIMENELPEVWRRAATHYVMQYAAELMDVQDVDRLWEANRKIKPTDRAATYAMLELQKLHLGVCNAKLDFSKMDLRGISLTRFMTNGDESEPDKKDMKLFRNSEMSKGTVFDEAVFQNPGHTDTVNCVAVTNDALCVSGSVDMALRVWDIRTGECLRIMEGHTSMVNCVAVTQDGLCISGSSDNTLRVWDIRTGECLRIMEGHNGWVNCVAVIDDKLCISGSDDRTLRVWDLRTGKCQNTMDENTGSVRCVAVTQDGVCVSGSSDNTLRVWDIRTGKCLRVIEGHSGWVNCVAVTEDGLCVSGSDDNTLCVWDIRTGHSLRSMEGHINTVSCISMTQDGVCVSGSSDNTLRVWDIRTGKCLRVIEGHSGWVNCVAVTGDGLCVSGSGNLFSDDKTLRIWDMRTGRCLCIMKGHTRSINCVTVAQNGLCVSGSRDDALRVWDLYTRECIRIMNGHNGWVNCVAMTKGGQCVSGSGDRTLRVWDIRTGECLRTMTGHVGPINCVTITDEGLIISGSGDRTLRVWDIHTGVCLRTVVGNYGVFNCVAVINNSQFVSGSRETFLRVWDVRTGECLYSVEGHDDSVNCIAVTEDERCISGSDDKTIRVWNLRTGECLRIMEGHSDSVNCIAVTENEQCISGSDDNTLRVWDIHTGECICIMVGHTSAVKSVAVTDYGQCISGSDDNTIRVWDIQTGECIDVFYPMEVDTHGMDLSNAIVPLELVKPLLQSGAKMYSTRPFLKNKTCTKA